MEKQNVYIETSVISYLTARPSRDVIISGHQQTTYEWWINARHYFVCFISDFVTLEISKGDSEASKQRVESIKGINILTFNDNISKIADIYFKLLNIPEKSKLILII